MSDISGSWRRGFEAAKAASQYSNGPQKGYKLGSALYAGSVLLSVGFNDWSKTSRHATHNTWTGNIHAEIMSLIKRRHYDNPKNLILYVSRTTTNSRRTVDQTGCSRPCNNCMAAIRAAGVRRVRFYNEQGQPEEIKL